MEKIFEICVEQSFEGYEHVACFKSKEVAEQVTYWLRQYDRFETFFIAELEVY